MMFLLKMVDYSRSLLSLSTQIFFDEQVGGIILGLQDFSVSPSPLLGFLGFFWDFFGVLGFGDLRVFGLGLDKSWNFPNLGLIFKTGLANIIGPLSSKFVYYMYECLLYAYACINNEASLFYSGDRRLKVEVK